MVREGNNNAVKGIRPKDASITFSCDQKTQKGVYEKKASKHLVKNANGENRPMYVSEWILHVLDGEIDPESNLWFEK